MELVFKPAYYRTGLEDASFKSIVSDALVRPRARSKKSVLRENRLRSEIHERKASRAVCSLGFTFIYCILA